MKEKYLVKWDSIDVTGNKRIVKWGRNLGLERNLEISEITGNELALGHFEKEFWSLPTTNLVFIVTLLIYEMKLS